MGANLLKARRITRRSSDHLNLDVTEGIAPGKANLLRQEINGDRLFRQPAFAEAAFVGVKRFSHTPRTLSEGETEPGRSVDIPAHAAERKRKIAGAMLAEVQDELLARPEGAIRSEEHTSELQSRQYL